MITISSLFSPKNDEVLRFIKDYSDIETQIRDDKSVPFQKFKDLTSLVNWDTWEEGNFIMLYLLSSIRNKEPEELIIRYANPKNIDYIHFFYMNHGSIGMTKFYQGAFQNSTYDYTTFPKTHEKDGFLALYTTISWGYKYRLTPSTQPGFTILKREGLAL